MPMYSDAAKEFANAHFPQYSETRNAAAFGFDAGHAAALATPSTPAATEGHSAAANAYAATRWVVDSNGFHEAAEAYDAALAAQPAPRTITTAAELDALPAESVVLDAGRDAWQKSRSESQWFLVGGSGKPCPADQVAAFAPLTLLAPVAAVPTPPVRLTDPDDPRIRDGALVSCTHRTLDDEASTTYVRRIGKVYGDSQPYYTVEQIRDRVLYGGEVYLLAEAPDPDAEAVATLLAEMEGNGDWTETDVRALIAIVRASKRGE